MRKGFLFLLCFYLLFCFATTAQITAGGRAAGMAGATVALSDVWSAFHNQAGLAQIKKFNGGIYNETPFLMNELSTRGLAAAIPVSGGVFGLSLNYYGFDLYNEKRAGLAFAKAFSEKISAGIQIDYLGTSISEGYGSKSNFTFEAGARIEILTALFLGVHIYNPIRTKLADDFNEKLPAILKAGLAYHPSDKVVVSVESEKNSDAKNVIKAGVEYHIVKMLYLRSGVASNPSKICFGFGLDFESFKFDFAASHHQDLGYSPNVSLTYLMK